MYKKSNLFLISNVYLFLSYFFPQSYALYITGDENATSTDVSKYLAKLSAGVVSVTSVKDHFWLHPGTVCFWLNPLTVFVDVCAHVNMYWQSALITCKYYSFLLQGPVTQRERQFAVTQVCVSWQKPNTGLRWKQSLQVYDKPFFPLTQNLSLTLWAVWENPFFSPSSAMLTFFSDKTKPNNSR